jgi:hypothetical protein
MDLGSEIRDPEKTYSGSRGQKGTGSRIRNTGQRYGSRYGSFPFLIKVLSGLK